MLEKRAQTSVASKTAHALFLWLAADSPLNPVNVGIFIAALLFGMNA
ncbi:MAG: hypothetical protein WBQ60_10535 [Asticcacaulis sp.]